MLATAVAGPGSGVSGRQWLRREVARFSFQRLPGTARVGMLAVVSERTRHAAALCCSPVVVGSGASGEGRALSQDWASGGAFAAPCCASARRCKCGRPGTFAREKQRQPRGAALSRATRQAAALAGAVNQ